MTILLNESLRRLKDLAGAPSKLNEGTVNESDDDEYNDDDDDDEREGTNVFHNGDRVKLYQPYSDGNDEIFTLSQWDGSRGWIGDEQGRGWYVRGYQIELANEDDLADEDDMYEGLSDLKRLAGIDKTCDCGPSSSCKNCTAEESTQMREWANSIDSRVEDKGKVMDSPEGEVVDTSLRRYLNASPTTVAITNEDHTESGMLREYTKFKESK